MKVLTLDLSSKASGWCIGTETELIDYGCFEVKGKNPYKRIIEMREKIINLISNSDVEKIIIEEVPVDDFKNTHTYKILTYLQGNIIVGLEEKGIEKEIVFLHSSSWRKLIGIKTGAGVRREDLKPKDIKYANEKYNLSLDSDDIADAICLKDAYFKSIEKKQNNKVEMAW